MKLGPSFWNLNDWNPLSISQKIRPSVRLRRIGWCFVIHTVTPHRLLSLFRRCCQQLNVKTFWTKSRSRTRNGLRLGTRLSQQPIFLSWAYRTSPLACLTFWRTDCSANTLLRILGSIPLETWRSEICLLCVTLMTLNEVCRCIPMDVWYRLMCYLTRMRILKAVERCLRESRSLYRSSKAIA